MEADQSYFPANHAAFPPRYARNGCDFIEQYSQNCYANPLTGSHGQPLRPVNGGGEMPPAHQVMAQQNMSQAMFGPLAGAPVLPPIRPNTKLPPMESAIPPQYRHQESHPPQKQQPPKDEKATGGVAAHLDYDMEQMSDFVAEMAQGMYALYISKITLADIDFVRSVYPGTTVPPQFRKYVLQVLSSTRLPSSTILLGLYYLASRMRQLSSVGVYTSGSAQVYRMLTTALLLGSKFLDDNTFQNRSWAEVSNIPVEKLNSMELEWLKAFDWKIHERIHNQQDGFMTWKTHWENWRAKAAARANEHKLTPIDTSIQKQNLVHNIILSPEGPIPPQYQRSARVEHSWLNPVASEYSPPSAPHSGPNTPDYYSAGPWGYANPPPPYTRAWVPPAQQYIPQPAPRSQPPSYHHTPSYSQSFANNFWTGHGASCGCLHCAKHKEHMFTAPAFGIQPVAG